MYPYPVRSKFTAPRVVAAAICSGLIIMAAAAPAFAQCDPGLTEKLTALDPAANDTFGFAVAISGDTVVVGTSLDNHGAMNDGGSAYVYVRTGDQWTQQAKLIAHDAAADDLFGYSVAVSGDTVVVGALFDDHLLGTNAGSAYVFTRSGGVWTQEAKLTAADAGAGDAFGVSVAIEGGTVVIGANQDNLFGAIDGGSAYVFTRSGTLWTQQAKLTALDAAATDMFGSAVALSGDTALIGASNDDNAGGTDAGAAYTFIRLATIWVQQAKITASDAAANDNFGRAVSLSGATALVGATGDDLTTGLDGGAAYVFTGLAALWTQQAKLRASDGAPSDYFGYAVAVSGDTAVVGVLNDDHSGGNDGGSAYVYVRSGVTWTQHDKVVAFDTAANDYFGISVALRDDTAVVGAYTDDHPGVGNAGSAYVFPGLNCDADGDGVPNGDDACPNNAPGLPIDCTGRPLRDCVADCLVDGLDILCIVDEMLNQ